MSGLFLLAVTALFLVGPRLILLPRARDRPEIHGYLKLLDWINRLYCACWHGLRSEGMAPLPAHGPAILIANHTCSVDNLLLQAASRRVLGFMVAQEFYDHWALRHFCRVLGCIPVRRDGRDLAAARGALRAIKDGRVVPLFPEGRILPKSGRELGSAKPGVAFLALRSRVPVIPAYISGTPESNDVLRSLLTPSHSRIVFGPPVDLSDLPERPPYDKQTLAVATDRLMGAIQALQSRALAAHDDAFRTAV